MFFYLTSEIIRAKEGRTIKSVRISNSTPLLQRKYVTVLIHKNLIEMFVRCTVTLWNMPSAKCAPSSEWVFFGLLGAYVILKEKTNSFGCCLKYGFWKMSLRKNATLNSWTLSSSQKGTFTNGSQHLKKSYDLIFYYRYLFVKMKVFNYSELHFSEGTSFKIHTLVTYMNYLPLCVTHLCDFLPSVSSRIRQISAELFFKRVLFKDVHLEEKIICLTFLRHFIL